MQCWLWRYLPLNHEISRRFGIKHEPKKTRVVWKIKIGLLSTYGNFLYCYLLFLCMLYFGSFLHDWICAIQICFCDLIYLFNFDPLSSPTYLWVVVYRCFPSVCEKNTTGVSSWTEIANSSILAQTSALCCKQSDLVFSRRLWVSVMVTIVMGSSCFRRHGEKHSASEGRN